MLFVGRITRQKGIAHLLKAAAQMDPDIPLVLIASSPDTPELGAEVEAGVAALRASKGEANMIWVNEHLSRAHLVQALTHAGVFACPSVYEPLGIVNLEAMACETAVVASDVGGIPEVVVEGGTGHLVHYDESDPVGFETSVRRRAHEGHVRPGEGRGHGCRGTPARRRRVRLGQDRPDHGRRLPEGHRRARMTQPGGTHA